MTAFSWEGPGFRVREAGPEDNEALLAVFADVHLKSDLDVILERDPDFFAMLALHQHGAFVYLVEDDEGRPVACGTVTLRDAWLDGERMRVGYLCDLRVVGSFRGGASLARAYGGVVDHLRDVHGVELCTTVIFDANERARSVLTGRSAQRRRQPSYRTMTPFDMASIQTTTRKGRPSLPVTRATEADLDALVGFLARRGQGRLLGEDFTGDLLQHRLDTWPELSLSDFRLVKRAGQVVGCLAPWDSAPVKRTRVLGYHGPMRGVKLGFDWLARLGGFPRLPDPGETFRFSWLTHLEIADDDPEVLNALLRATYADLRPERQHFLAAMIPRGSRLDAGLRGFRVNRTAMTLYAVHAFDGPWAGRDFETQSPGFEMALS